MSRLSLYTWLFRWVARLCWLTGTMHRGAQRVHDAAWALCTAENLRTCCARQPRRERFG